MTTDDKAALEQLRASLQDHVFLYQMYLFGSRARGDADPDSDMDVLVVVDGTVTEELEEHVRYVAWEVGLERGVLIAPVVFSRDEWENGIERYSLLALAVECEGVPV